MQEHNDATAQQPMQSDIEHTRRASGGDGVTVGENASELESPTGRYERKRSALETSPSTCMPAKIFPGECVEEGSEKR
jgi:hypothetical protein